MKGAIVRSENIDFIGLTARGNSSTSDFRAMTEDNSGGLFTAFAAHQLHQVRMDAVNY